MRKYTGYKDIKGNKIYFEDTVVDWNTGCNECSCPFMITKDTVEWIHPAMFPMVEIISEED